ncbi:hypothetical protein DIPPA_33233 [Diplonema papillatum]|nr:hypothetical protein DIPPA_33233 [Diplonema papillatum]
MEPPESFCAAASGGELPLGSATVRAIGRVLYSDLDMWPYALRGEHNELIPDVVCEVMREMGYNHGEPQVQTVMDEVAECQRISKGVKLLGSGKVGEILRQTNQIVATARDHGYNRIFDGVPSLKMLQAVLIDIDKQQEGATPVDLALLRERHEHPDFRACCDSLSDELRAVRKCLQRPDTLREVARAVQLGSGSPEGLLANPLAACDHRVSLKLDRLAWVREHVSGAHQLLDVDSVLCDERATEFWQHAFGPAHLVDEPTFAAALGARLAADPAGRSVPLAAAVRVAADFNCDCYDGWVSLWGFLRLLAVFGPFSALPRNLLLEAGCGYFAPRLTPRCACAQVLGRPAEKESERAAPAECEAAGKAQPPAPTGRFTVSFGAVRGSVVCAWGGEPSAAQPHARAAAPAAVGGLRLACLRNASGAWASPGIPCHPSEHLRDLVAKSRASWRLPVGTRYFDGVQGEGTGNAHPHTPTESNPGPSLPEAVEAHTQPPAPVQAPVHGFDGEEPDGTSLLHRACHRNNAKLVRVLLRQGAVLTVDQRTWAPAGGSFGGAITALMASIQNPIGDPTEVCRLLISAGADVDVVAGDGQTALYKAILHKRTEVIDLLETSGARWFTAEGTEPLILALGPSQHNGWFKHNVALQDYRPSAQVVASLLRRYISRDSAEAVRRALRVCGDKIRADNRAPDQSVPDLMAERKQALADAHSRRLENRANTGGREVGRGLAATMIPSSSEDESLNSGDSDGSKFAVKVVTLSMGLTSYEFMVKPTTTIRELRKLLEEADGTYAYARQRVTYNRREVSRGSTEMQHLRPPAQTGSKFLIALELERSSLAEKWKISVVHFDTPSEQEAVVVSPDQTMVDVLAVLKQKDSHKWDNGVFCVADQLIDQATPLRSLPGMGPGAEVQFSGIQSDGVVEVVITKAGALHNGQVTRERTRLALLSLPGSLSRLGGGDFDSLRNLNDTSVLDSAGPPANAPGAASRGDENGVTHIEARLTQQQGSAAPPGGAAACVRIASSESVRALKAAVEESFARGGRRVPRARQKLVHNSQIREDEEKVSSIPAGDAGTAANPIIIQVFLVPENARQDASPTATEASDDPGRPRSRRCNVARSSVGLAASAICFTWAVGLCIVAATTMATRAENGYCYIVPSTDMVCARQPSGAWGYTLNHARFQRDPPVATPCDYCSYLLPGAPAAPPRAHAEAFAACAAPPGGGVSREKPTHLPVVSRYIPGALCDRIAERPGAAFWLDGRQAAGSDAFVSAGGLKLALPASLWAGGAPPDASGDLYLTVVFDPASNRCVLQPASSEQAAGSGGAYAVCASDPLRVEYLQDGQMCEPTVSQSKEYSTTAGAAGYEECKHYCNSWGEQALVVQGRQNACLEVQHSAATQSCRCRRVLGVDAAWGTRVNSSGALSSKLMFPLDTRERVTLAPETTRDFWKLPGWTLDGIADITEDKANHTAASCVEKCVEYRSCESFTVTAAGACFLWSFTPGDWGKLSRASGGADTYAAAINELYCNFDTQAIVAASKAECLAKLLMRPATTECRRRGSFSCEPGHERSGSTGYVVFIFAGICFLLSLAAFLTAMPARKVSQPASAG